MDLTLELDKLRAYMEKKDTDGFKAALKALYEKCSPDEKEVVSSFVEKELEESTNRIKKTVNDVQVRMQLESIIEILPLSYISKNYFNKTRQWLYQRVNGSTVNGRLAKFTDKEVKTFNYALQDISSKIGSIAIS